MNMNEIIAMNIHRQLSSSEKNQQDLAKALALSQETISKILSGIRMLSAAEVHKIAEFFNIPTDMLLQQQTENSPLKVFMGEIHSDGGRQGIKTAEALMKLYTFHHRFQNQEYINKCNQVWSDE